MLKITLYPLLQRIYGSTHPLPHLLMLWGGAELSRSLVKEPLLNVESHDLRIIEEIYQKFKENFILVSTFFWETRSGKGKENTLIWGIYFTVHFQGLHFLR